MQKIYALIFLLVFFSVLIGGTLLTALTPGEIFTVYENRWLVAARPALTVEAVTSGSYFSGWEDYLKDQIWGRNTWLGAQTRIQLALSRPFVNNIMITGSALLPMVQQMNLTRVEENAQQMAEDLGALRDKVESYGGVFLYVGVPNQYSAYREEYPDYLDFAAADLETIRGAFFAALKEQGIAYLDLLALWQEPSQYYYKTDHHMTLAGGVYTCQMIFDTLGDMGVETGVSLEDIAYRTLPNPFYGSRSRKLYELAPFEDAITVFANGPDIPFVRYDDGEPAEATVFSLPANDTEAVSYGVYMGGDWGETVIATQRPDLPDALIFGDSYTNAVETVFYSAFDETRSLDLRHYEGGGILAYVEEHRPMVVVCVRDDSVYLYPEGNGNIQ